MGVGKKQDFDDVMRHRIPAGRVPLWELHFHLWSRLSNGKFISGKEFDALSDAQKHRAVGQNAEVLVSVGQALGFSAVSIPDGPWDCIYTLPETWRLELVRQLKKLAPDFYVMGSCGGVIFMPSSTDDYTDFCYRLFDEPEEIDRYCETLYKNFLEQSTRLAEAGIDGIYIAADVADNRAPFFNPEQLQRWYFPYLKKNVAHLKSLGLFAILHTDGNISRLLDDIKASGIDALQAIDPVAGMDIVGVKRAFGNEVAVCGNLDCGLMLTGTPDAVYASASDIIKKCKPGGGFVFGNTNAVDAQTPLENYRALLAAWNEHGKY